MAADVAGSAGDKNGHRCSVPSRLLTHRRAAPYHRKALNYALNRSYTRHPRSSAIQDPHSRTAPVSSLTQLRSSAPRSSPCPPPTQRIRKAVFPVAGLGTRFLPATKAMPKEMLTVVDRPVIQHVVDEARAAGIEHFIFVTGRNKGVDRGPFRQASSSSRRRLPSAARRRSWTSSPTICPAPAQTSFTRQQAPLGLGHAVWCAREIVGDEPFALLLPDMLHHGGKAVPRRDDRGLQRARRQPHRGRRRCRRTRRTSTASSASRTRKAKVSRITQMVEKPQAGHGAVEPAHHRPLHPAAGDLRPARNARSAAPAARSSSPTR